MCNVDNHVGWAPPSYLKKCEDKMENESDESDEDDMTSCKHSALSPSIPVAKWDTLL